MYWGLGNWAIFYILPQDAELIRRLVDEKGFMDEM